MQRCNIVTWIKPAWLIAAAGSMYLWGAIPAPRVDTIIRMSVADNDRDWSAAPEYSYSERDSTDGGSRTYRVTMILGSPYRRLAEVNGEPLTPAGKAQEQRKLDEVIRRRRLESAGKRARRIAAYSADRQRDHQLLNQLTEAFNFRLLGLESLGPRRVYVLEATPRPGYIPPTRDTRVLTGMEGKLWIDTRTFQWVKVEAEVVHPVWIEGFVARVEPGTRFVLEYAPVDDHIWLPVHYQMQSRAQVLWVFPHRGQADQYYSDYRKTAPLAP